jgi:CheY-like chemotaxis protein
MGKKILLADDSITIQKVIELTFSDEDFEVVTVGNGRLAVEKVQDVRPDLVLCDIIMPEKDGYEVCDFIKKTPSLAHIPVLLLTGAFEPFDQDRATRVGCDGFLAKPFEPQTLIAKVKDLLNQAATRTMSPPRGVAMPPPAPPVSVPPPSVAPPVPALGSDFEEEEPSFISDEPLEETPTMITPAFSEMGRSMFDDPKVPPPPPAAVSVAAEPDDLAYVEELPEPEPEELMDVSPEESSTLQGGSDEMDDMPAPWAQPTVEVPLELRAQASVESAAAAAAASEPAFDEVFEEEPPAPSAPDLPASHQADVHARAADEDFGYARTEDVVGSPVAPSVPSAPAASPNPSPFAARAPEPEKRAPEPLEAAPAAESSFSSVADEDAAEAVPVPSSVAAEVGVPVDMVEKIAQRVVAQISEKVIREIAWEVIPDLAESLIKKEIDRLKAELQQT